MVKQREAALAAARNDLAKTAISAPVDGVVISRQVDAGQTVAASLNTPTLFTIAQDLRQMQVEVAIDESDIGKIRQDQRVTFTVDAFSGRTFEGRVRQIRKAAQTVQNVVTYIVVVETPNANLLLVPGMTANVRIIADSRDNVLKMPNAALRWRPAGTSAAKDDPAPGAQGGAPNAGDAQARRQRLVDELKLDTGQQARLDEIFDEMRNRMAELREVPEADRRTRGERLRADVRQKINAMLNTDQQKLYAEIVAERNRPRRHRQRTRVRAGRRAKARGSAPSPGAHRRQRDRGGRRRPEGRRRSDRRHAGHLDGGQVGGRRCAAPALLTPTEHVDGADRNA